LPPENTMNQKVTALHEALGIPVSYADDCGLPFHADCQTLVPTEKDVFDRQPFLSPDAFDAWRAMQALAGDEGIVLQIVSAFRSAQYQADLLQRKLDRGESIERILTVNAAPGFSEHHTGCAIDITTPGYAPLEEIFEQSPAFSWLCRYAGEFGFSMSFPRDNAAGIAYEPWHWKYSENIQGSI